MIEKLTKVNYKLKKVHFEDGLLVDEQGEVINLENDLRAVYGKREFDVSVGYTAKSEHEVSDFQK